MRVRKNVQYKHGTRTVLGVGPLTYPEGRQDLLLQSQYSNVRTLAKNDRDGSKSTKKLGRRWAYNKITTILLLGPFCLITKA